ncbi:MAG: glycosyltransferase family 39 protein [Caldilineales bacterium]|nr:glycosyltransferase family 39 protein [Caldilineales bacterium]
MTTPGRTFHPSSRAILTIIIIAGLALRLLRLDFQPLWWDEGYSVWFAGNSLGEMIRLTAADIHPPLYYALLHGWSRLLGLAPSSLRLLSVFVSVAAIPLAYLAGRDMASRRAGLIAAALVALNPMAIFYGQEIRMYGLAATLSMAALWLGWRWGQPEARKRLGVGYALSLVAGLYTLYYFALLPIAQILWMLLAARGRWRAWLASLAAAALLYLPWILYAGPQLLDYVSYKVTQDNDTPLSLLPYWGRHLSAFTIGHLEGSLAPLWPWALLLLIVPGIALVLAARSAANDAEDRVRNLHSAMLYLFICLALPLLIGFIQQLQAPFIPDRFERVLLFTAPALWLLLAIGFDALLRESLPAALVSGGLLLLTMVASLYFFYTTPRYSNRDYRPLIENVRRNALPGDSVFMIFPWQTGYFWSYLPADSDLTVLSSPASDWGEPIQSSLDQALNKGAVWFPEHLALGAILESDVEDYLGQHSSQLVNRWYGDETRLTAFAQETGDVGEPSPETPIAWENGVILDDVQLANPAPQPGKDRLFITLNWRGDQPINPADLTYSLWLTDPQGVRWAQRDINPFAHPWPPLPAAEPDWQNQDRIAMNLPIGTPPGDYDLWIALLDAGGNPISLVGGQGEKDAWLTGITIPSPPLPVTDFSAAQYPADEMGDGLRFRGHSLEAESYLTGDDALVEIFWEAENPIPADLFVFVQLLDDSGEVVAGVEGLPVAWYATSQWAPGTILRSLQHLRIPAKLAGGEYRLIAGLFDPQTNERVQWDGQDRLDLGRVKVVERAHSDTPVSPQHPADLILAGGHRLLGYDLAMGEGPGSPVNLTLYWQPGGATDLRYSSFVHLLAADETIVSQSDHEPANGEHPTTSWIAGEIVTDAHTLTRPLADTSASLSLAVGLYDPVTGARLPFVDENGGVIADHITLPLQN